MNGFGIRNDSGLPQHFANPADAFYAGRILFFETSTAGDNTTFDNSGGTSPLIYGGSVGFYDSSTAGSAVITNEGGTEDGAHGGSIGFLDSSTAGQATIIEMGGTAPGAYGGYTNIERLTASARPLRGQRSDRSRGSWWLLRLCLRANGRVVGPCDLYCQWR